PRISFCISSAQNPLSTPCPAQRGSDTFHMAASSARREAVAYRPSASWFEGARLQCPAPLDDRMIEQFECQAKSRQFLFLDGVGIVAFERFADDDVDLALHRQQFLIGFHGVHPGNHSQDSPTARSS